MKKRQAKKRRTAKQSKREFTAKTRVYDLVKREFHDELKHLIEDIRPFIRDGDTVDWKHFNYFGYDEGKISKTKFIIIITRFLLSIGKGEGLKCKLSVFVRYLASNEHSNFGLKYRSLNTLIYRQFEYFGE